jgi:SH3-like domain-containing protein
MALRYDRLMIVWATAALAAGLALTLTLAPALAGGDAPTSGLPVPRFVSLKTDRVNVRGGPDKDHDVAWI